MLQVAIAESVLYSTEYNADPDLDVRAGSSVKYSLNRRPKSKCELIEVTQKRFDQAGAILFREFFIPVGSRPSEATRRI